MLRVATRGSALALAQARLVGDLVGQPFDLVVVQTAGDRRADVPIWEIGGQGVFVKEVQAAVLDGRADIAVHSAKDLPSTSPPGLVLAAVPERADPRDALVGSTLDGLPPGARVATGSVRRRAQLAALRPDLTFVGLRGNMETRLAKAADHSAIVVAACALDRLGKAEHIGERLSSSLLLPQVGQGALAVEAREGDEEVRAALAAIEHGPSRRAVDAERAYLRELGGGCDLPVAAHAVEAGEDLELTALLASLDGHVILRRAATGSDSEQLGRSLARTLLDRDGGAGLLSELVSESGPLGPDSDTGARSGRAERGIR